ncbi:hypothetical protein LSCM1_07480 [Leishmania martiniquensis]|uniref:Uncharacterized protein n=1 Tax=Leishmania martiniquensis TaxID=1580590 RepID=A0A836L3Q0_9TRYP|nr:hypothetical protein LSCM1_07480 [Leishmania martiniquensis]
MGNGMSGTSRAGSPHSAPARASSAASTVGPRTRKVLVNAAPRTSTNNFRSPAAITEASVNRQNLLQSPEVRSASLQQAAAHRRQHLLGTNGTGPAARLAARERATDEEDSLEAFTRNADPASLRVLELIQQSDAVPPDCPSEKLRLLQQCYPLLEIVPKARFDQLAVTVHQKEGDIYYQQEDMESAKSTYSRAVTLAEKRVARQETDMYTVLKRYVLAMVGMARIWYNHERDRQGFTFADQKRPRVHAAADDGDAADDANASMHSLESSLVSDGGSVFSLNQAILKSMAPRPPRRQTGPLFQRVHVRAPHVTQDAQLNRENEFVLHSRVARELVASPCELLLLRCCEVVQIGHNAQSELLIPAQIELAQIYEDLGLYSRALLLVRRCMGILCSVYDYDHPWVVQLAQRADKLEGLLGEQTRNSMATKIQATWKMHRAMQQLEDALGHPVRRHQWIPRKYRTTPDLDFLGKYASDMPEDGLLGDSDDDKVRGGLRDGDGGDGPQAAEGNAMAPKQWSLVPQTAPEHERDLHTAESYYPAGALVRYAPTEHAEGGDTFTTVLPNATVVGTTQDTQTDTNVQHTEYGDVLTVRTTTITKTVTEDDVESTEDGTDAESSEDAGQSATSLPLAVPPPPPQQQQQHPRYITDTAHPAPPAAPYPYDDDADECIEEQEYSWAERVSTEPQQQPPPLPMRRAEQTQLSLRSQTVSTQARLSPPRSDKQTEASAPPRHREDEEPPRPRRQSSASMSRMARGSESVSHLHPVVGIPSAVARDAHLCESRLPEQLWPKPEREQSPPHSPREGESALGNLPRRPGQSADVRRQQLAPPSHASSDDVAPLDQEEEEEHSDAHLSSLASSRPHAPSVRHHSRREQLGDLVQPNASYEKESNGCPLFLPPLGYRGDNGQGCPSGMPVFLEAPTSEYPSALPHVPRQPRTIKTTRDYRIVKTRRVRTYVREPAPSSAEVENSSSSSGSVTAEDSMSSARWEEGSVSGSSCSRIVHSESVEEDEDRVDAASIDSKPNSTAAPRQQHLSQKARASYMPVPHRPHKPWMPTPPTKPMTQSTGNGSCSSDAAVQQPTPLPVNAEAIPTTSEKDSGDEGSRVVPGYSTSTTTVTRHVKSGRNGTTTRTTRRYSTSTNVQQTCDGEKSD